MYKQDLQNTLLGIGEEANLELGPREEGPSVVLAGGSAFILNDVTNRSVTHDIVDLHSKAFIDRIDRDLLERLIFDEDEALASSPSERSYQEMVCAYGQYKKEVRG